MAGFPTYRAKFEAMLSAHYIAAVVLHDGALTLTQFEPARYDDPALRAFAAERVEVVADPALDGGQAIAELHKSDGSAVSARCEHPRGSAEKPAVLRADRGEVPGLRRGPLVPRAG